MIFNVYLQPNESPTWCFTVLSYKHFTAQDNINKVNVSTNKYNHLRRRNDLFNSEMTF